MLQKNEDCCSIRNNPIAVLNGKPSFQSSESPGEDRGYSASPGLYSAQVCQMYPWIHEYQCVAAGGGDLLYTAVPKSTMKTHCFQCKNLEFVFGENRPFYAGNNAAMEESTKNAAISTEFL